MKGRKKIGTRYRGGEEAGKGEGAGNEGGCRR